MYTSSIKHFSYAFAAKLKQCCSSLRGASEFAWHHLNFVFRHNYKLFLDTQEFFTPAQLQYYDDFPEAGAVIPAALYEWLEEFTPNRWQCHGSQRPPQPTWGDARLLGGSGIQIPWNPTLRMFVFYRHQDAVLFKLSWGGRTA